MTSDLTQTQLRVTHHQVFASSLSRARLVPGKSFIGHWVYKLKGDLVTNATPAATLEVPRNLRLVRISPSLWCVRAPVLVHVCLADTVMCPRRLVSENSQLTMEP